MLTTYIRQKQEQIKGDILIYSCHKHRQEENMILIKDILGFIPTFLCVSIIGGMVIKGHAVKCKYKKGIICLEVILWGVISAIFEQTIQISIVAGIVVGITEVLLGEK